MRFGIEEGLMGETEWIGTLFKGLVEGLLDLFGGQKVFYGHILSYNALLDVDLWLRLHFFNCIYDINNWIDN